MRNNRKLLLFFLLLLSKSFESLYCIDATNHEYGESATPLQEKFNDSHEEQKKLIKKIRNITNILCDLIKHFRKNYKKIEQGKYELAQAVEHLKNYKIDAALTLETFCTGPSFSSYSPAEQQVWSEQINAILSEHTKISDFANNFFGKISYFEQNYPCIISAYFMNNNIGTGPIISRHPLYSQKQRPIVFIPHPPCFTHNIINFIEPPSFLPNPFSPTFFSALKGNRIIHIENISNL